MLSGELCLWKHSAIHLLLQQKIPREAGGEISVPPRRGLGWISDFCVTVEGTKGTSQPHWCEGLTSPCSLRTKKNPQKCKEEQNQRPTAGKIPKKQIQYLHSILCTLLITEHLTDRIFQFLCVLFYRIRAQCISGNINVHGVRLNAVNMGGPKPAAKSCSEAFRKCPVVEQLI